MKAVSLIKSHIPSSIPRLSHFSNFYLLVKEMVKAIGGMTLLYHGKNIL